MIPMLRTLAKKTLSIRHGLVRIVAPRLYVDAFRNWGTEVPRPMTLFLRDNLSGPLRGV